MTVPSSAVAALVNLVGFLAAAALYAMLLAMVWRGRGPRGRPPFDRPALAAALLGLAWNVGQLLLQSLREWGGRDLGPSLNVAAFTALGLLPACAEASTGWSIPSSSIGRTTKPRAAPSWRRRRSPTQPSVSSTAPGALSLWACVRQ